VYANEVVFWQDIVAKAPHNARAANNLGMALAMACQPLAAGRAFDNAAQLAPADPRPRVNRELLARGELPGLPARCSVPKP
jgi:Flp pilus assembly protein TadD